mmetsp:Transcript_43222/g.112140  ORF Transcript_43222/g.112140 Transcript_43222/m.112140 type:complete len:155 (+) Transcript_43222:1356-1820(+)
MYKMQCWTVDWLLCLPAIIARMCERGKKRRKEERRKRVSMLKQLLPPHTHTPLLIVVHAYMLKKGREGEVISSKSKRATPPQLVRNLPLLHTVKKSGHDIKKQRCGRAQPDCADIALQAGSEKGGCEHSKRKREHSSSMLLHCRYVAAVIRNEV